MGTIILGTHKTIESVIVEFLQPLLELIALLVQPIGKAVSYLVDFSIRHLYGFGVPYLDLLVADHDFLGDVRRCIQQGVFHQGNAVVATMLSPHTESVPDIGIVHPCLHGILVRTRIVAYHHLRVEKVRGIVGIKVYGNPSLPEVEIQVHERNRFGDGILMSSGCSKRYCPIRSDVATTLPEMNFSAISYSPSKGL